MLNLYLTISSTCSTYYKSYVNTYFNHLFNRFNLLLYIFLILVLQSSLVMMTGKVMGHSYTGGQNDTELLTRQFAVLKSQQQMQMNWRSGHTLYLFLHWKGTPQVIFTMVMRQLYSTNLFLIELIALLMTSL